MATATTQRLPRHPKPPLGRVPDGGLVFESLVAHVIGPIKLATIEAMLWIAEPLSPTLLVKVLDGIEIEGKLYPGRIAFHLHALEGHGVIERVSRRPVRGSHENFYFFSAQ